METRDIYKIVLDALSEEKEGRALKQRYQLKDAIMKLGPAGFIFEDYVGEILEYSGSNVKNIRKKIRGECVIHEIDLIVVSEKKRILVECKYHSKHGRYIGLKESLYTHARFLDTKSFFDGEYLICNTKVSNHAKKYAKCINQKILSWKYPPNNSLENIIERHNLYPITILNLNSKELKIFLSKKIMLAKNLLDYSEHELSKKTGMNVKKIKGFQNLIKKIIN